jgi:hypothetical protein
MPSATPSAAGAGFRIDGAALGAPAAAEQRSYGVPAAVLQHQPHVTRNIFADIDISSLQGLSAAAAAPFLPTAPPAVAVPMAPRPVPVTNIDDAELALPSYAAFRRSAGSAAFTAVRPGGGAATATHTPSSAAAAAYTADANARSASSAAAPTAATRAFPTAYQPRSLGGPLAAGGVLSSAQLDAAMGLPLTAYAPSDAARAGPAAARARPQAHGAAAAAGVWQPLVFNMADEFGPVRSTLSTENSMSLSAHTASAAGGRGSTTR